jgi:hypothetical protein
MRIALKQTRSVAAPMSPRPLTNFQRKFWLANTATFAAVFGLVMYNGRAFDGELVFPVGVFVVVIAAVSAMLRAYIRDKKAEDLAKLFPWMR